MVKFFCILLSLSPVTVRAVVQRGREGYPGGDEDARDYGPHDGARHGARPPWRGEYHLGAPYYLGLRIYDKLFSREHGTTRVKTCTLDTQDPVHREVTLPGFVELVINHRYFQRMKEIKYENFSFRNSDDQKEAVTLFQHRIGVGKLVLKLVRELSK